MPRHDLFILAALYVLIAPCAIAVAETPPQPVVYWHNWTDHAGVSHIARCTLHQLVQHSMADGIAPEWKAKLSPSPAATFLNIEQRGWVGNWHENPKVQWVMPIQGAWTITAMDGHTVTVRPGEIALGEDQNTRIDAAGHKGHLAKNTAIGETIIAIVQLNEQPTVDRPCRFE